MAAGFVTRGDLLAHLVEVVGNLGDQDDIRRAGETGVQRDESRVTSHDFDDEDPIVTLRRRMQSIDRFECDVDRGVKPERRDRAGDVVVDRLRHTHQLQPFVRELICDQERAVPANRDHRIDAELPGIRNQLVGAIHLLERAVAFLARPLERIPAIRRAEDGAAKVRNPAYTVARETDDVILAEESRETALDPEDFPPPTHRAEHHRTYDGVQPGRVAAAGRQRYAHDGPELSRVREVPGSRPDARDDPAWTFRRWACHRATLRSVLRR